MTQRRRSRNRLRYNEVFGRPLRFQPLPTITMQVTAIIAAAGDGRRMASGVPKQFRQVGGVSLLQRSVSAFCRVARITDIIVVTRAEAVEEVSRTISTGGRATAVVAGGATRQESVAAAFDHVAPGAAYVMVHDAARPFVTPALIERTLDAAIESGAAIAALPARDTVKQAACAEGRPFVARTIPREEIYLAQTPQAFRRDILAAAVRLGRQGAIATDESALAELAGSRIRLVDGDALNFKVTTESDLALSRGIAEGGDGVRGEDVAGRMRAGTGYDLHRLVEGRPLLLGGVQIPSDRGALGHSDADVVCHVVTDAVLGAAGAGDIGRHYPDTSPEWKDASSIALLRESVRHVKALGFDVVNVDVSVILERPKIATYVPQIQESLAAALGIDVARVSVKGKTNEGLDAVGRGEAIAAHAVALLRMM
jgi:2-C-methyl-D-erythritol 4-phosphate cytidylyltransferase/2-C-methyl-D-erythritol 2,4-cyclodiphosphate synthase